MSKPRFSFSVLISVVIIAACFRASIAKTWFVAADGSGDAPTVAAAIDSTETGDMIVLGPGTHAVQSVIGSTITLKVGTTLTSQMGPMQTFVVPSAGPLQPGLFATRNNCVISGLTLSGGQNSSIFCSGVNVEIFDNIVHGVVDIPGTVRFHNNLVDEPVESIYISSTTPVQIYNNIVLGPIVTATPNCFFNLELTCNLIQGPPLCVAVWQANISGDPIFCSPQNYFLQAQSPCAPGHTYDGINCGLIGPLPVGCGTVKTQPITWGAVKALYLK
jgi:hypothetical protein